MVVLGYFFYLSFLFEAYAADVGILYLGHNVVNKSDNTSIIKIIEGSDMVLECTSGDHDVSFTWSRNDEILTINSKLEIQTLSLEDEDNYTCSVLHKNGSLHGIQTVFIDILFPPSKPVINIPDSVLAGEELVLTCLSKSDPVSTYKWEENHLLVSRITTYQFTVSYPQARIYCYLQGLMLPHFSEPKRFNLNTYVLLNVHLKANLYGIYPSRYVYLYEGDNMYLRCQGQGRPVPSVWWTKKGDENVYVTGERFYRYKLVMSDTGDYICNVANTVIPTNGTNMYIHKTNVFHVYVLADTSTNTQSPQLSCSDCLNKCPSKTNLQSTSPTIANFTYPARIVTTVKENVKSDNCTSEQESDINNLENLKTGNDSTQLVLIIISITGWTLTIVMFFLTIYIYRQRNKHHESDNNTYLHNTADSNRNSYNTSRPVSAYVTDVRILDGHYTDLTTYDQISSASSRRSGNERDDNLSEFNDIESVSTQASVVTYMEPVTN